MKWLRLAPPSLQLTIPLCLCELAGLATVRRAIFAHSMGVPCRPAGWLVFEQYRRLDSAVWCSISHQKAAAAAAASTEPAVSSARSPIRQRMRVRPFISGRIGGSGSGGGWSGSAANRLLCPHQNHLRWPARCLPSGAGRPAGQAARQTGRSGSRRLSGWKSNSSRAGRELRGTLETKLRQSV